MRTLHLAWSERSIESAAHAARRDPDAARDRIREGISSLIQGKRPPLQGRSLRKIEHCRYDQVVVEAGEIVGSEAAFASHQPGKKRERFVMAGRESRNAKHGLALLAGAPEAHGVCVRRQDVAGIAVDFHILARERPAPGRLDHGIEIAVIQQDGRIVLYPSIDIRLEAADRRRDAPRPASFQKRRDEIDAVATEIGKRAVANTTPRCARIDPKATTASGFTVSSIVSTSSNSRSGGRRKRRSG